MTPHLAASAGTVETARLTKNVEQGHERGSDGEGFGHVLKLDGLSDNASGEVRVPWYRRLARSLNLRHQPKFS
ncbi:Uncharacterised protein [Mycobacteroides abscessus subsp. abscessus]|nr:Uncharacterised protein [Mycobacteroides abscessus subsp. abscessus]